MKEDNKNKLIVVGKKVKKTFNDGTKLVVRQVNSFGERKIGKFKGYHILGAVVLVLILILGINMFSSKDINYPIVYNNSDGDLYLMGIKGDNLDDAVKLAKSESTSNVIYANTTDRYVLFQKDQKLYLYDAESKDQTTKIMDNVETVYFTEDDKYIIALDKDRNLNVYNYKDTKKIESDVSDLFEISKDRVVYEKEGKVYVRSINPKKDDRKRITDEYDSLIKFSKDGSKILYLTETKDLYAYNIKKDKNVKIAENVNSYYCDSEDCSRLFYVEVDDGKTIYFYEGKKATKVANDVYMINASNADDKQIVYSKLVDGKYTLYYQVVDKDAVEIEDNLTSIRSARLYKNKEIYYVTGKNDVKYVKINGAKLGKVKELASDVTGYLHAYKDGYVFVGDISKNSSGTLYMATNGVAKKIDDKVNSNIITVSKSGNKVFYLKDYKKSGDLYVSNGGKGKKIDSDVYTLEYVKDKLIYYIKDYSSSKSRGDLYRYTGKSVKIADNVTRIANPPVTYSLD